MWGAYRSVFWPGRQPPPAPVTDVDELVEHHNNPTSHALAVTPGADLEQDLDDSEISKPRTDPAFLRSREHFLRL